jgi:ComF family protein
VLCPGCLADMRGPGARCDRCGSFLISAGPCVACTKQRLPVDATLTARAYTYPATMQAKELKYRGKIFYARQFATDLSGLILQHECDLPEVLLPVPLHPLRKVSRGFNQADGIAGSLSKKLGIPVDRKLLKRNRNTLPQSRLSNKERRQNLKGAFSLSYDPAYKRVAIIDDILTSGSTANEIAALLKKAGVKEVLLWAWANAL